MGLFRDGLASLLKCHKPKKLTLRNDRIPVKKTLRYTYTISNKKYNTFKTIINTQLL